MYGSVFVKKTDVRLKCTAKKGHYSFTTWNTGIRHDAANFVTFQRVCRNFLSCSL